MSREDNVKHQEEIEQKRLEDARSLPFWDRISLRLRQHYKALLIWLGVGTIPDIVKEFVRGKLMDALYEKLGGFGLWLRGYPLAFITLGLGSVLAWLAISTIKESRKRQESIIYDEQGVPYTSARISRRWAYSFAAVTAVCIVVLVYGTFRYYQISRGHFKVVGNMNVTMPLIAALNAPQGGTPSVPLSDTPPSMLWLFTYDFPATFKVTNDLVLEGVNLPLKEQVYLDFFGKSEFVGFYIPPSSDPVSGEPTSRMCISLAERVGPLVEGFPRRGLEMKGQNTTLDELTFTGRVFIYYEDAMSIEQQVDIRKVYKQRNLDVQFRDSSYLMWKLDQWQQQKKKS